MKLLVLLIATVFAVTDDTEEEFDLYPDLAGYNIAESFGGASSYNSLVILFLNRGN